MLESTIQSSRQREAVLDEALASTDISIARSHLQNSVDGHPTLNNNSNPNEGSKKEVAFENGSREEENSCND